MSKGYTTVDDVAAYLGATFTVAQASLCIYAIAAAEQWIDHEIRHAWLEAGPLTDTIYDPKNTYLRLLKAPIVSVTSVAVQARPGYDSYPLMADRQYFVENLRDGVIYSPFTQGIYKVTVVYEPNADTVPDEVHLAATALAASNMRLAPTMLDGVDPNTVLEYEIGGELRVRFRTNLLNGGVVPQSVLSYLDVWRKGYSVV